MIVVIRNASGFDLFLAISATEKVIRFRVTAEAPKDAKHVYKLRARGEPFAMGNCPEGIGVQMDAKKAGVTLRVSQRREMVDRLDEFDQIDGEELYREFTLHLLN